MNLDGARSPGTPVRQVQVTFDCADPRSLSEFWCEVLGYVIPPPPPGFDSWDAFRETLPEHLRNSASACEDPSGDGPRVFFQRVPEGKTAKNRMHIDIRVAGEQPWDLTARERLVRAKAAELVALGASFVREESYGEQFGHIVMVDPEGNEFCVA